ncbi:MAG: hypothetical protein QOJ21_2332 [Solirubrobacteraceae bacterium]|nr:hypothetical protein [Solirubrobacteraceae bacterium]
MSGPPRDRGGGGHAPIPNRTGPGARDGQARRRIGKAPATRG